MRGACRRVSPTRSIFNTGEVGHWAVQIPSKENAFVPWVEATVNKSMPTPWLRGHMVENAATVGPRNGAREPPKPVAAACQQPSNSRFLWP